MLYNQNLQRNYNMEIPITNFSIHSKKAASLSRTLSRFSTLDPKLTLILENRKQTLMAIKNTEQQNPSMEQNPSNSSNLQINQRGSSHIKTCINKLNKRQVFKSVEVENRTKKPSLQNKNLQRLKPSYSSTLCKKEHIHQEANKLSLQKQDTQEKPAFRIIDLLRGNRSKQNYGDKKRIQSEDTKNQNVNYERNSIIKKSLLNKQDHSEKVQKLPFLKLNKLTGLQTSNQSQEFSSTIQYPIFKEKAGKFVKFSILKICSHLNAISIHPFDLQVPQHNLNHRVQKVDVEIQTIQSEPQFFEYLAYKRKKQQYKIELENSFEQLQLIKQDRKLCHERAAKIQHFYDEPPKNDREERIFELKKQIQLYQSKIMAEISIKHKDTDTILERIQQMDFLLLKGLKKLQSMNKSYLKVFKQIFQKHGQQKYFQVAQKIETLSSNIVKEIYSKIKHEIQNCQMEKENTQQLKYCLSEFMKCVKEEKVLLRNCFGHIKYMPELFYKLFGDEVSQNESKDFMAVFSFSLKQKGVPKCLKCYNSDRKMSLIVEKNLLIQSILKVADQLVS